MKILRGLVSGKQNDLKFAIGCCYGLINSNDLDISPWELHAQTTSYNKNTTLVLPLDKDEDLSDTDAVLAKLQPAFEVFRADYAEYYNAYKNDNSPAIRDANPVIIIYPGVGMFSFAKNKQTTRVASEFYINAINVMRGAEAITEYTSLPRQEAFDIEYWLLEEAKLQRMPKEQTLSRKVALVTGAAGGIGKAIADKLVAEGANVFLTDIDEQSLLEANATYKRDISSYAVCNVTDSNSIAAAYKKACLEFGGVDIIVHSAGLPSQTNEETTHKDWSILQDVLVKGQFDLAKQGVEIMRKQKLEVITLLLRVKMVWFLGPIMWPMELPKQPNNT